MKDNYSEMNVDMEQILLNKNYDELSASELDEIKDFVSSKEEFNIMKSTLVNVKTSFGVEEEIVPVDSAKENLMKMFEQKHGKVIPMNKPRPFYLNPVFQIGVAAMFILGIIYFYPKGENESMTAMNETKDESPSENKEMKEEESSVTEAAEEETPAEESTEELKLEEKSVSDYKPGLLTEDVPMKADVKSKNTLDELAKSEGPAKASDKDGKDLAELETDVNRSSSKKEKEKVKAAEESLADDASVTYSTNTVTTGNTATGGVFATSVDAKGSKKDSDKKTSGKVTHTNTAGGYYNQPGVPSSDLKQGVSLKDEPALAEFLFTAL